MIPHSKTFSMLTDGLPCFVFDFPRSHPQAR